MNNPKKPIVTFCDKSYSECICYLAHIWNRQDPIDTKLKTKMAIIIISPKGGGHPFTVCCELSQLEDYCRYR
jgi:hypothetical protein